MDIDLKVLAVVEFVYLIFRPSVRPSVTHCRRQICQRLNRSRRGVLEVRPKTPNPPNEPPCRVSQRRERSPRRRPSFFPSSLLKSPANAGIKTMRSVSHCHTPGNGIAQGYSRPDIILPRTTVLRNCSCLIQKSMRRPARCRRLARNVLPASRAGAS